MAELEPLGSNPFVLTVDEQARFLACRMERFEVHCSTEFHLSVFFDGTNNNRYRDTPRQAHSNVARLFDIFEEKEHQFASTFPVSARRSRKKSVIQVEGIMLEPASVPAGVARLGSTGRFCRSPTNSTGCTMAGRSARR